MGRIMALPHCGITPRFPYTSRCKKKNNNITCKTAKDHRLANLRRCGRHDSLSLSTGLETRSRRVFGRLWSSSKGTHNIRLSRLKNPYFPDRTMITCRPARPIKPKKTYPPRRKNTKWKNQFDKVDPQIKRIQVIFLRIF